MLLVYPLLSLLNLVESMLSAQRGSLGTLSPPGRRTVNLGTEVDCALVKGTILVCALAVCLLYCMRQGCWAFCSIAFFTNMVSRASVVRLCTNHRALPSDRLAHRLSHAYPPSTLVPSTAQPGPLHPKVCCCGLLVTLLAGYWQGLI